jgi:indole-3-glycerol phosphate synthase
MFEKINSVAVMNILDTIIAAKKQQVAEEKSAMAIAEWERQPLFKRTTLSLRSSILATDRTGIIAEFKRRSPSKGIINDLVSVKDVTKAYTLHGASGLSVLTDHLFFGGSENDLRDARFNEIPILQKDFIIDEYQVVEAKAIGADVILLIAACLSPGQVKRLAAFAKNLGLEVLLELHAEKELEHICPETELIGINNRNLQTFEVDIERSLKMAEKIPADKIKIAESGIHSVENIRLFKKNGFKGFLIGENFMKARDPGKAFEEFVEGLKPIG